MRTTLNIDDDLLKEAKIMAVREGTTLTALLERALRERLSRGQSASDSAPALVLPAHIDPHDGVAVTAFLRDLARKLESNTDHDALPCSDAVPAEGVDFTSTSRLIEAVEGPFARS
jgi:hypothetical protein